MRFTQLDRILELNKGQSIRACRCLALSEGYLEDHFPRFPVMPGVLMVEAAYQASMWLVRISDDYAHAMIQLKETKNLKFQGFVQPGDTLTITSEIRKRQGALTDVRIRGTIDGQLAVSGRMILESYNLAEREQCDPFTDDYMNQQFRKTFARLYHPAETHHASARQKGDA